MEHAELPVYKACYPPRRRAIVSRDKSDNNMLIQNSKSYRKQKLYIQ